MALYDFKKIEKRWRKKWKEEGIYEPDPSNPSSPFYNLMMFPYPSAEGLHVGNMYAFTGSDIYGRFKRMKGHDVFEPIGLDGFGIHSENYALKINIHPAMLAKKTEKNFYSQLDMIGNGFAWNHRLETYDPSYYKWTQWLFVQMFKHGLAYRKKASVNWCPKCLTVLADEQIIGGKCERCDTFVIKKDLEQWFFRITRYADRLLKNLDTLDWSERVKIAQRNWIGESHGVEIKFAVKDSKNYITVFTTRPETIFGATYVVLAPESPLVSLLLGDLRNRKAVEEYIEGSRNKSDTERISFQKEKTGILLDDVFVINPATKKAIPLLIADYVLGTYGTGAVMAVPAHDERDFEFARIHKLPVVQVIDCKESDLPYEGVGKLINSGEFTGMDVVQARDEIAKHVKGETVTRYKLRDWLISRQRYWGPPIPMIYCSECAKHDKSENAGWHPVPESELPVLLPKVKNVRPTGTNESPLASVPSFYKTQCPECGSDARRETDVLDTFLDSAWYFLRYLDSENNKKPFESRIVNKWLPVSMYIGGVEHSVLHLLYTRFVTMALHDWGFLPFEEPFLKFRAHGLLIKEGTKMSKSKGNVVNPDEYIERFGSDVLRMYLMFLGPFEQGGDFIDRGIVGIVRFLEKIWRGFSRDSRKENDSMKLLQVLHSTIEKVTHDIEYLRYNTAISSLMELWAVFEKEEASDESRALFVRLIAPFAPHIAEELWRNVLKNTMSVHGKNNWPEADVRYKQSKTISFVVQVNGKVRDVISVERGIEKDKVLSLLKQNSKIQALLKDRKMRNIVFVRDRLLNFVVSG
ncbi:MAG: leucine--tRNA ligase [Candidatus Harrisonbacteria bacterium RIFOXYD1_FULL_40_9]|uniref:Leucine--tRNA ligase n=1 Tax=Candidatus Harrisonbacteria bacterium RIFOXYD1_FULL_40_9 TaxID=1798412 RepID=A0A1G1ZXB8_9BACT|nr:MAG: leucine--tRNA ligase [Candidatus Harrisonbacteria bacterium RIFOXYD1_FULL_40_9]